MKKYLMLDRRVLNPQAMKNVILKPEYPEKDKKNNPLFGQDHPWEIRIDNGYPNVIYDERDQIFRCYYTLFIEDKDTEGTPFMERYFRNYEPRPDRVTALAYAESKDGIHWNKPVLERVVWKDCKRNNLIFRYAHGSGVMLDKQEKELQKRYKMVTKMDIPGKGSYMAVSFSENGKDWCEPIPWPEHNPTADSHNYPFYSEKEKCYFLISRIWKDGIRVTTISRSKDFLHWSEPKETLRGRGFENQIYSMPVFEWGDIYLGLASIIHEGDQMTSDFDQVDCELTWSADAEKFDYVCYDQPIIPRGKGVYPCGKYDNGCIYASPPVEFPDGELWFYYMGGNGRHTNFRETFLARAHWKKDQFAGFTQRYLEKSGILFTGRLTITGNCFEVLLREEREFSFKASLHESWREAAVEGYSARDCYLEMLEDSPWYRIIWKKDLSELCGKNVCLKIEFQYGKIFAIQGDFVLEGHRLWEGADLETEEHSL